MALSYTLREGLAGFSRAKFSAAMAMTALAVALVLIGLVGLLAWEGQRTADLVQQAVGTVEVFLEPVDGDDVARLRARLVALPGVDSVRFVSQQEAAAIFRRDFGDEAAQFDSELFLPASFRVRLGPRYAVSDSLAAFKRRVDTWIKVDEVVYNADLVESIEGNIRRWSLAGLGIGLLVVLAALLLVGNTVRLTIYARRLLIRTMKLVGATDGFIRRPFLVEGVVQGLGAGVAAAVLVWVLHGLLTGYVEGLGDGWPGGSPVVALGALVLLGVLLGWAASWVAVRRFVKRVRLS